MQCLGKKCPKPDQGDGRGWDTLKNTTDTTLCKPDFTACFNHLVRVQAAAQAIGCEGKTIIASYGQNPTTGDTLRPIVHHVSPIDDQQKITQSIINLSTQPHRNVYMPLCLMRPDLPTGKKGGESDVVAVFGLVADFDDNDAHRWPDRLPHPPDYVLETSSGRFQAAYVFDRGIPVDQAKAVAEKLQRYSGCDFGTKDVCHVWRIAGTLNWPNKKKVTGGRNPEPQMVGVVHVER